MRVLHITPSFYPAHVYGGPTESVYRLCLYLLRNGCEVRILTTDANGRDKVLDVNKEQEVEMANGLRARYCKRLMRHSVSPGLVRLLPSYIRWADVVHLTAVYSFPTIPTLLACKVFGKPVIWSPRGSLQRWEGSTRPILKTAWEWICRIVAPKRFILHVTSEEEAKGSLGIFPAVEAAIIPNGIEIPEKVSCVNGNGVLRLLYVGRFHPIKGIENLLAACQMLDGSPTIPWSLTIVGGGDQGYTESLLCRTRELALSKQVQMIGEVVGEAKKGFFEHADIVIVPSHTENFGMVVAEALAHGVPVIAGRGTPWRKLEEIGCGLWVDNDPESLAQAIHTMSKMPLREMGQRGRKWMEEEFAWSRVAQDMSDLYNRLLVNVT